MLKLFCYSMAIALILAATFGYAQRRNSSENEKTIEFNQTRYLHRWSQSDQHEFTPTGQEDLSKWSDMMTINFYREVSSGEALATVANQVLENYRRQSGIIVKTSSAPRTAEKPAEHLIVAVLGTPAFLEAVQVRFKLVNGKGVSIVHSHRLYGSAVGDEMSAWLKTNGPSIERELMAWQVPPSVIRLGS